MFIHDVERCYLSFFGAIVVMSCLTQCGRRVLERLNHAPKMARMNASEPPLRRIASVRYRLTLYLEPDWLVRDSQGRLDVFA